MPFDPDKYLAKPIESAAFNPDDYLKKKGVTIPSTSNVEQHKRDFSALGEQLSKSSVSRGEITKPQQPRDNEKINQGIIDLAKKNPTLYSSEEGLSGIEKSLIEHNIPTEEINQYKDLAKKSALDKINTTNIQQAKGYLSRINTYGRSASLDQVANASDDQIDEWKGDAMQKGISEEALDSSINDWRNEYLTKKADQKKLEFNQEIDNKHKMYAPSATSKEDADIDKAQLLTSKLMSLLPKNLQTKAAANQKYDEIVSELKSGKLTGEKNIAARNKLVELTKLINQSDMPEKLFHPVTGQMIGREQAPKEAVDYEQNIIEISSKLTDKEKTLKNVESALYRYEAMNDLLNQDVQYIREGDKKYISYKDALALKPMTEYALPEDIRKIRKDGEGIQRNWIKTKSQFDAINRAYMTNTNPAQVEKGFFKSLTQGYVEAEGMKAINTSSDINFVNEYVSLMDDLGAYSTPAQKEAAKSTTLEKVGAGLGGAIPLMRGIAISGLLTEGAGTIPLVSKLFGPLEAMFVSNWGKTGKFIYGATSNALKGGVTFEAGGAKFSEGVGENITQTVLETMLGKKGKTMNQFLKYGFKTFVGGTEEVFQEYGGDLVTQLNRTGVDVKQAFINTYGRNAEDATDKLIQIGLTSLLLSGAFNGKVLLETRQKLSEDLKDGNIPEEKVKDVKSFLNKTKEEAIKAEVLVTESLKNDSEQLPATEIIPTETSALTTETTKPIQDDTQDIKGIPSTEQGGETIKQTEPISITGQEEISTSGDVKTPESKTQTENAAVDNGIKEQGTQQEQGSDAISSEEPLTPKGETLTYTQTRKGKKETIKYDNVNTKEVLHTDEKGNTLHSSNRGFVSIDNKGKVLSNDTTKKLVREYQQSYDYSVGEKADVKNATDSNEADSITATESKNPQELAQLIERRNPQQTDAAQEAQNTKEGAIARVLTGKNVNPESYMSTVGLKRKDIHAGILMHHFKAGGKSLDVLAMEAMDILKGDSSQTEDIDTQEITIKDVTDFIEKYPNTSNDYFNEMGIDEITQNAKNKFRDITGIEPTDNVLNLAVNGKQEAKVHTKESLIQELNDLPSGANTESIAKKAKELGLLHDKEFQDVIGPKATEYFANKNKLEEEAIKNAEKETHRKNNGFADQKDEAPFQKQSRKTKATKDYVEVLVKKLKKALPNIEVIYDNTIDGSATLRDGKIIINLDKVGIDTPIHEFSEVFTELMKRNNPLVYLTGLNLVVKDKVLMDEMRLRRPDLKTETEIAHEILNELIGISGSEQFEKSLKNNTPLKSWYQKAIESIRQFFGIKPSVKWAEVLTMNLNDFTNIVAKDLLNEVSLSNVSSEQFKAIVKGDVSVARKINISSGLLKEFKDSKVRVYFKDKFLSSKNLPTSIAGLIYQTDSKISGILDTYSKAARNFDEQVRRHIKEDGLDEKSLNDLLLDINSYFTNDVTINTINAPEYLNNSIIELKNTISDLSSQLVGSNLFSESITATINANMGMYLHRSYDIHKVRPKSSSVWLDTMSKIDEENGTDVVGEAYRQMQGQIENIVNNIKSLNVKFKNGEYSIQGWSDGLDLDGEPASLSTNEIKIDKETLEIVLSIIKNENDVDINTDNIINNGGSIDFNGNPTSFKDLGIKFDMKSQIESTLYHLLDGNISESDFVAFAGMNKKDVSILKHKKNLPEWYRDLLGEVKDPALNYLESVTKMTKLLHHTIMLNTLKAQAEGSLIYANKSSAPNGFIKISSESNPKWAPLSGYYIHPDFKEALDKFEEYNKKDDTTISLALAGYKMISSMSKAALTSQSIMSNARNHITSPMMTARLSISPTEYAKMYADFWRGTRGKGDEEFKKRFEKYKRFNYLGSGVTYNVYRETRDAALERTGGFSKKLAAIKAGRKDFSPTKKVIGKVLRGGTIVQEANDKVYMAPDATSKMVTHEFFVRKLKEIYPSKTIEEIELLAHEEVVSMLPTFDRMPEATKKLSRNILIGSFSSFSTEQYRNSGNQLRSAYKYYKLGLKENNSEAKALGIRLMAGLLSATLVIPTIAIGSAIALGLSRDDLEKIKSVMPEWSKNAWLINGRIGDGSLSSVDLSFSDPQSIITKSLAPFFNNDNKLMSQITESLWELSSPFIGKEALANKIYQGFINEDDWGNKLISESESNAAHIYQRVIVNPSTVLVPKAISELTDIWDSYWDKNESKNWGDKRDTGTLVLSTAFGIKYKRYEIQKLVGHKMKNYVERYRSQQQLATPNSDIEKDKSNPEQANIERIKLFKEMRLNVELMELVGVSRSDIKKTLTHTYGIKLNNDFVKQLMDKTYQEPKQIEVKDYSNKNKSSVTIKSAASNYFK